MISPTAVLVTSKPLLNYSIEPEPDAFHVGVTYRALIFRPGAKPIEHTIRFVTIDHERLVFQTDESSATAPIYRHHAKVEAIDAGHSLVTDTVEIDAGRLTLFMAAFAHVIYRYRRYRLRGWIAERG